MKTLREYIAKYGTQGAALFRADMAAQAAQALDDAYASAEAFDARYPQETDADALDASYEQSFDHLNRIAGDRR